MVDLAKQEKHKVEQEKAQVKMAINQNGSM